MLCVICCIVRVKYKRTCQVDFRKTFVVIDLFISVRLSNLFVSYYPTFIQN